MAHAQLGYDMHSKNPGRDGPERPREIKYSKWNKNLVEMGHVGQRALGKFDIQNMWRVGIKRTRSGSWKTNEGFR